MPKTLLDCCKTKDLEGLRQHVEDLPEQSTYQLLLVFSTARLTEDHEGMKWVVSYALKHHPQDVGEWVRESLKVTLKKGHEHWWKDFLDLLSHASVPPKHFLGVREIDDLFTQAYNNFGQSRSDRRFMVMRAMYLTHPTVRALNLPRLTHQNLFFIPMECEPNPVYDNFHTHHPFLAQDVLTVIPQTLSPQDVFHALNCLKDFKKIYTPADQETVEDFILGLLEHQSMEWWTKMWVHETQHELPSECLTGKIKVLWEKKTLEHSVGGLNPPSRGLHRKL